MTPDRSERIRELFADALDQPAEERAAFLATACGPDTELRAAVESLLQAHAKSAGFAPELEPKPDEITASAGTMIGRYRIVEPLGEGGFGVVYRAEQLEPIRRQVALKVIKAGMDTREVVARFDTERQALALMDHPGIARVLDAGTTDNGHPYFVMELVSGTPITEYCDHRRLNPDQRLRLFVNVCHAVQHAHQKGIIHRDLKPTNILVEEIDPGLPGVPKIIDFGVAKALGRRLTGTTVFTRGEQLLGTPAYMSPEQAERGPAAAGDVDTRSDIYALGVLLYELLTGTTPFDKETLNRLALEEVRRIVRETEPPKPSTRVRALVAADVRRLQSNSELGTRNSEVSVASPPRLPHDRKELMQRLRGDLDWIVMKALEKDRRRRYDTASTLAQDIERHLGHEPVIARPPSRVYRFQKLVRRNRLTFAAAGAVILALALGAVLSAWQWRRAVAGEALARQRAYDSDINLAQRALADLNLGRACELLDRHRPPVNSAFRTPRSAFDLRGWEWRYLWKQTRGTGSKILTTRPDMVQAMAISADGKRLAIRDRSERIAIWDMTARRQVAELPAHGSHRVLGMSARGDLLASGANEKTETGIPQGVVRLWDLTTFKEIGQLVHANGINCLAVSPDGRWLATHGTDRAVRLWDLERRQETTNYPAGDVDAGWATGSLAFSPASDRLAFGDTLRLPQPERDTSIFELRIGERTFLPPHGDNGVTTLAFAPDGRTLAVGYGMIDTSIRLWDVQSARLVHRLVGHSTYVYSVAFLLDGKTLASAALDQTVRLWDVESGRLSHTLLGHTDWVQALAVLPEGKGLVSGDSDGIVRVWDLSTPPPDPGPVRVPVGGWPWAENVAFLPDSRSFVAFDTNGTIVVRNTLTGREEQRLTALGTNRGCLTVSPDGRLVAAGGPANQLSVWDRAQRRILTNTTVHTGYLRCVSFGEQGRVLRLELVSEGDAVEVKLWDTRTWQEARPYSLPFTNMYSLIWSPDDRLAVLGDTWGNSVTWWDAASGQPIAVTQGPHRMSAVRGAFSPDGRRLATASWDGRVVLWDTRTRQMIGRPLRGHLYGVWAVAVSPGGQRLATGSSYPQDTVKLWDVETGAELVTLPAQTGFIQLLAFSPDGNTLMGFSTFIPHSWLYLWHAPSWEEIAAAEREEAARDMPRPK